MTSTVLNEGKLDNGTSFREILDGSSFLVPSVAHERARAALYNNAYTIEEFSAQLNAFISLRKNLLGLSTAPPCRFGYGTAYLIWIAEIERAEELLGNLAQGYKP